MKLVSKELPKLDKGETRLIDKKKLLKISDKLREILKKEGKVTRIDENFSSARNNLSC